MHRFFICSVFPTLDFYTPSSKDKTGEILSFALYHSQLQATRNLQAMELQQDARYLQARYLLATIEV